MELFSSCNIINSVLAPIFSAAYRVAIMCCTANNTTNLPLTTSKLIATNNYTYCSSSLTPPARAPALKFFAAFFGFTLRVISGVSRAKLIKPTSMIQVTKKAMLEKSIESKIPTEWIDIVKTLTRQASDIANKPERLSWRPSPAFGRRTYGASTTTRYDGTYRLLLLLRLKYKPGTCCTPSQKKQTVNGHNVKTGVAAVVVVSVHKHSKNKKKVVVQGGSKSPEGPLEDKKNKKKRRKKTSFV